jgi:hypothetical protein
MFCLCRTCVLTSNTGDDCHTTDEERALTGTRVIDDVWLVVQKGYRILEVYELYEYNITRFDHEAREGGRFAGCIDTFVKSKAEASSYPSFVQSLADEERYIESFWKSEGIRLDRESIRPNAAKRGLAKLFLNSMW